MTLVLTELDGSFHTIFIFSICENMKIVRKDYTFFYQERFFDIFIETTTLTTTNKFEDVVVPYVRINKYSSQYFHPIVP